MMNVWKSRAESKDLNDDIVKIRSLTENWTNVSGASLTKFAKAMALSTSRTA